MSRFASVGEPLHGYPLILRKFLTINLPSAAKPLRQFPEIHRTGLSVDDTNARTPAKPPSHGNRFLPGNPG
jgi:hypothetical protein